MNIFGFIGMMGNYDSRAVGRYDFDQIDGAFVSTAYVTDGSHDYETAVCHPAYRDNGDMVIVEAYDTKEDAEAGHARWVETMTASELPDVLSDCQNSALTQWLPAESLVYPRRDNI